MLVSRQHIDQYNRDGFFLLDHVLSDDQLEGLRGECSRFIQAEDRRMDELGTDTRDLNFRGKRYFLGMPHRESTVLTDFIFSPTMEELTRAVLGPDVWLYFTQYVVKGPEVGLKFAWHQDSAYIGHPHAPYLSCWIPLDDVTVENGTVYVLPYDRGGGRRLVEHSKDPELNDLVGYQGDDPGIPAILPAGGMAVFSSLTLHRSGPNTTPRMRRIYLIQYSPEPLMNKSGTGPFRDAIPFLKDGERIVNESLIPREVWVAT
ncbi:MAG: Phytanoyl-CoA dioxygenase (PhyH) [candidate division BRC1 bacterium ADurb.BinA292]|nr:MAG: Phytanoyl-CoA dioxygenase (PhyH) [candidate division BRC1 bacterium ADurb.BinA292]